MLARVSLLGALLVALAGCAAQTFEGFYTCANPDEDYLGADGTPDPCHKRDPVGCTAAGKDGGNDLCRDAGEDAGEDAGHDAG